MAPSPGHIHNLVAKNMKFFKAAWTKTSRLIERQISSTRSVEDQLQPIFTRPKNIGSFPRSKGRSNITFVRQISSSGIRGRYYEPSLPKASIANTARRIPGRAPFSSTLRPNLTGGTLNRTAGGYGLGSGGIGSARYFSHCPDSPAEVVHNVYKGVREFLIAGKKAQFDGICPYSGEKRYRTVTSKRNEAEHEVAPSPMVAPGSSIDFCVLPTITSLMPLNVRSSMVETNTLTADGLLDDLQVDFSRAMKDLATVHNDLKKLSSLGDLLVSRHSTFLRVHFPGRDANVVERLCDDLGVQNGIVHQDDDYDPLKNAEIDLLFPFVPSSPGSELSVLAKRMQASEHVDWGNMLSPGNSPLAKDLSSMISDWDLGCEIVRDTQNSRMEYSLPDYEMISNWPVGDFNGSLYEISKNQDDCQNS